MLMTIIIVPQLVGTDRTPVRYREAKQRANTRTKNGSEARDDSGDDFDAEEKDQVKFVVPKDKIMFKRCPLIGAVTADAMLASNYCFAYGLKNVTVTLFKALSGHHGDDVHHPWEVSNRVIRRYQHRLLLIRTATPSGDVKSPFQTDPGTLNKRQGPMRFLQIDRKMIHYVDMIRSGLIIHVTACTMERSPHRSALIRVYYTAQILIQDSVPTQNLESLHEKMFARTKDVQVFFFFFNNLMKNSY